MRLRQLPLVEPVVDAGADDPIFDGLLLAGPVVIGLIAVLGRSLPTLGLATLYIAVFVGHTLSRAVR